MELCIVNRQGQRLVQKFQRNWITQVPLTVKPKVYGSKYWHGIQYGIWQHMDDLRQKSYLSFIFSIYNTQERTDDFWYDCFQVFLMYIYYERNRKTINHEKCLVKRTLSSRVKCQTHTYVRYATETSPQNLINHYYQDSHCNIRRMFRLASHH